jgi:predicted transcriptional regulator
MPKNGVPPNAASWRAEGRAWRQKWRNIEESLEQIWSVMNSRTLPCAPIVDSDGRAQGILHARDVALTLIDAGSYKEGLLRDYIMGVGYQ